MYWPEEGSETYGSVTVKHINTFSRAHFTVRMFSLKNAKNKKVCEIFLNRFELNVTANGMKLPIKVKLHVEHS